MKKDDFNKIVKYVLEKDLDDLQSEIVYYFSGKWEDSKSKYCRIFYADDTKLNPQESRSNTEDIQVKKFFNLSADGEMKLRQTTISLVRDSSPPIAYQLQASLDNQQGARVKVHPFKIGKLGKPFEAQEIENDLNKIVNAIS